jgi:hypothetical protein
MQGALLDSVFPPRAVLLCRPARSSSSLTLLRLAGPFGLSPPSPGTASQRRAPPSGIQASARRPSDLEQSERRLNAARIAI